MTKRCIRVEKSQEKKSDDKIIRAMKDRMNRDTENGFESG